MAKLEIQKTVDTVVKEGKDIGMMVEMRISAPSKSDSEDNILVFLEEDLRDEIVDAGYLHITVPGLSPHNTVTVNTLAHAAYGLLKRLYNARTGAEQSLVIRQLLVIQDLTPVAA
jgi:hypothetical protein